MDDSVPEHVAIIMDGNGRWARSKGLPRFEGHRRGASVIKKILRHAQKRGVKMLTLYAFSVENWERPAGEVSLLMRLLKSYLVRERKSLMKDGIRLRAIGDLQKIPSAARAELEESIRVTSENQGITLQLALSYGGRDEIVRACNRLLAQAREDALPITAEKFSSALDTQNQKDPDLIIRTSGELRISNFLLWQAAYAEFVVSSKRWPDFDEEEFDRMLEEYSKRERRFGRVGEETITSIKGPHSLLSKRRLNEA